MRLMIIAAFCLAYSSLSYAGTQSITNLTWKDKGVIKQKVTLADCKKTSDDGLNTFKEYRLFEINTQAFWTYLKKTEKQFATLRLPLPDGITVPVKLDKNSPIQAEYPEISRSFLGISYKPNKAMISGSLHELKSTPQPLRTISFEVTVENTQAVVGDHYSVSIIPLKKPNTYAVTDSRHAFACPRPRLLRR